MGDAKTIGKVVLVAIGAIVLALDAFSLSGATILPAFACGLHPFSRISAFAVSRDLTNFVMDQCKANPQEPAISIIFFMTKISLALASALFMSALVLFVPKNSEAMRRTYFALMEKPGGIARQCKGFALSFSIFVALAFYGFTMISLFKTPHEFSTLIFHKLFEDALAMLVYITIIVSLAFPVMLGLFLVRRERT